MAGANKLLTAGGGGIVLTPATSIASDVTVQIPSRAGNLAVDGPAFSAYNSGLSVSTATWTKLPFSSEEFDTNSNFASSTFTPTVAGYYLLDASIGFGGMITGGSLLALYKNGSAFKYGTVCAAVATLGTNVGLSCIVYFNGSTDYVELYAYQNSGSSKTTSTGVADAYFQGVMVRAA